MMSEHQHQAALFRWAALAVVQHPELRWLFAVPNGGKRDMATAGKLKAEGVKPGVPDIWLPIPRSTYHGFVCELKVPAENGLAKGRLSDPQIDWLDCLTENGWYTTVAYGWEAAREFLIHYLTGR